MLPPALTPHQTVSPIPSCEREPDSHTSDLALGLGEKVWGRSCHFCKTVPRDLTGPGHPVHQDLLMRLPKALRLTRGALRAYVVPGEWQDRSSGPFTP